MTLKSTRPGTKRASTRDRQELRGEDLEGRYRALVENMLNGVAYCQMLFEGNRPLDFIYLAVNPAFQALTGLQNVVGRRVTEVIPDIRETDQELFESYGRVARAGQPERFEYWLKPLDTWFDISVYSPQEGYFVAVFDNITKRKRAEQALLTSESNYRALFESAVDGIVTLDAQGRIDDVNGMACRMLGYTREDALGSSAEDIVAPGDVARVRPVLARIGAGEAIRSEWQLRRKDRTEFTAEVSAASLPGGRTLGIMRDITERRRAEGRLRLQSAALDAAVHSMVITDRNGTIAWVNPAFTTATGYTAEEVIGQNTRVLKSGVHDPVLYKDLWETILAGESWHGELTNRKKGGGLLVEDITITPVQDATGEITHFVAIKQDLTEAKQLEARFFQAQKMESVGQLAGGIAHDFNNLLTIINGTAEFVLASLRTGDPLRADLEEISRAGIRAAGLTRQLLAFSRKQILQPRVVNLNTVVVELESMLRRLLGEDIDLVVVPTPGLANLKADPGQLEQVIANLAVNARDAMPKGGRLTIEIRNVVIDEQYADQHGVALKPGPYVMLAVSDTGIGMDEDTRQRIFEPFFTTKGLGKGTGLGLSTVYGIVKQSDGVVWVYSEVGVGTTFKIYLPQVTDAAESERRGPTIAPAHGQETILLVEDVEGLRRLAKRVLESVGYTVLTAGNGQEALVVLERHDAPVHLIVTDIVMPGMSGPDLAKACERIRPGTRALYMSGYTDDVVVRYGVLDGGMPFLGKPFTTAELLRKVREVLDLER